jgi:hypothetical protein
MSNVAGKEVEAVVDHAELIVAVNPLMRKLGDALNKKQFETALQTSLELKVLFTHLYWHLAELPHMAINYAGITPTQEAGHQ